MARRIHRVGTTARAGAVRMLERSRIVLVKDVVEVGTVRARNREPGLWIASERGDQDLGELPIQGQATPVTAGPDR
jgi:hypothetical protein